MKRLRIIGIFLLGISGSSLGLKGAQGQAASPTSLGDLARQQRSNREKTAQKPPKVFTNDNLPTRPAAQGLTIQTAMSPEGAEQAKTEKTGAADQSKTEATESSDVHNEKYYRKAMSELRARKELHERELAVLQQKLSQNQMQFYSDPNKTLLQEFSRSDVNKLTQQFQKKKDEIAADDQAILDLQQQCNRESCNAGWLR